jgi:cytochrome c553
LSRSKAVVIAAAVSLAAVLALQPSLAQSPTPPPAPPLTPIALQGDAARGAVLAETCAGCHGVPGSYNAYPAYRVPKLGGQNADYLEIALQGYRRGTRGHATMQGQASSLTDQDIADVAEYFASRAGEPEVGRNKATELEIEEGRRKATACIQCHGQEGVAAASQWPNLAGQHESYLTEAMSQYKDGRRADLLMNPLIAPLDEATIEELAAYFASQPHLHNTAR